MRQVLSPPEIILEQLDEIGRFRWGAWFSQFLWDMFSKTAGE